MLQAANASDLTARQAADRIHDLTALQSPTSTTGNAQSMVAPAVYSAYKGDTSSDMKGERGKNSPGSVLTKSVEGSDDDIVVVPSVSASTSAVNNRGLQVQGLQGLRDDSELSSYGSSNISSLEPKAGGGGGGGVSAATSRRTLVQPASSSSSSSTSTNSDEGAKEDIDFARIGSDERNKTPSSDQLYYVNEVRTILQIYLQEITVKFEIEIRWHRKRLINITELDGTRYQNLFIY